MLTEKRRVCLIHSTKNEKGEDVYQMVRIKKCNSKDLLSQGWRFSTKNKYRSYVKQVYK